MRAYELMEGPQSLHIFCDMDGVLVDFPLGVEQAYFEQTGQRVSFKELSKGEMWKTVTRAGEGWWLNLPWLPGGKQLWNFIKRYKPTILSAPSRQKHCIPEKEAWVTQNLGPGLKVICDQEKWKYASQYGVLIDDSAKYVVPWDEHGGIAVHHTDTPSTIKQLKKLGFK